jgi:hypothetical protein
MKVPDIVWNEIDRLQRLSIDDFFIEMGQKVDTLGVFCVPPDHAYGLRCSRRERVLPHLCAFEKVGFLQRMAIRANLLVVKIVNKILYLMASREGKAYLRHVFGRCEGVL